MGQDVSGGSVGSRRTILGQLSQQPAPLRLEDVGPSEAAVPADHTQAGDAQLNQVTRGLQAAFPRTEVLAAGTADDGPSLEEKETCLSVSSQLHRPLNMCVLGINTGLGVDVLPFVFSVDQLWKFGVFPFLAPNWNSMAKDTGSLPRGTQ